MTSIFLKRILRLALVCPVALITLTGYSEPPQLSDLPSGPLLKRAPEFASWTLTIEPADANTQAASANDGKSATGSEPASKSVIAKTQNIYAMDTLVSNGRVWKKWSKNNVTATISPDTEIIVLGNNTGGALFPSEDFSKSDFPEVQWVSSENFVRIVSVKGKRAMLFSKTVVVPQPLFASSNVPRNLPGAPSREEIANTSVTPLPPVTEILTACIDLESSLPISMRKGNAVYTYEFNPPPQAMLSLPGEVINAWKREGRRTQDLMRPVPRAY